MIPHCSVVMATYNKADTLRRTLRSLADQQVDFPYETIVVDDGSEDSTASVCKEFPVHYHYLDRRGYLNSGPARNAGYRMAMAPIIVAQSDDVEYRTPDTLQRLVDRLRPGLCVFATVENVAPDGTIVGRLCGGRRERPYFFLGALWAHDLFAVGGNDEEFVAPNYEDVWLAECLRHRGLKFVYCPDVVAWHHDHPRPDYDDRPSRRVYRRKMALAQDGHHPWTARAGAWT